MLDPVRSLDRRPLPDASLTMSQMSCERPFRETSRSNLTPHQHHTTPPSQSLRLLIRQHGLALKGYPNNCIACRQLLPPNHLMRGSEMTSRARIARPLHLTGCPVLQTTARRSPYPPVLPGGKGGASHARQGVREPVLVSFLVKPRACRSRCRWRVGCLQIPEQTPFA